MKKSKILSLLLALVMVFSMIPFAGVALAADDVEINETNFPDANFREFVKQYDTEEDGKGYLSEAELAAVKSMNCSYDNIADLKGIEHFTALEILTCTSNNLTSLDVSANTALTGFFCGDNKLTSLNVSHNTALEALACFANNLTSLDVSANTALTFLNCGYNKLESLDVSESAALVNLYCDSNQLTNLDVSAVPAIRDAVVNGTKDSSGPDVDYYHSEQGELTVDKTVTIITDSTPEGTYTAHVPEDKTLEYGNTEMQTIGDFWASDFENLPTPTLANVKIKATCFTNGSNTIPFDFYWHSVNLDDPYYLWKVTETSGDRETDVVYHEDFHTTLYAQIEQSDWAAAVPGTYTATLTFNYSIEQDVGQGIPVAGTEKTLTTTLTVVVPEPDVTVIPSATITIDAPVIGAQPDYTAEFPEGAHYYSDAYNVDNMRNDIGWMDLTEDTVMDPDSDVFQAGHRYEVHVYLTAQDGYKLADSTIATVNGQVARVGMFGGQLEVIYTFPALEEEPVTEYDLWLGETRVTSLNQGDILGDGTASFDPETNTLTFTAETPAITGLHSNALIFADGIDLTINTAEKLTLKNEDDNGNGIFVNGNNDLKIVGDLDVKAKNSAAYSTYGSVTVAGDVTVNGGSYGIFGYEGVKIDGDVNAEECINPVFTVIGDAEIGGSVTVQVKGSGYGVFSNSGNITIDGNVTATGGSYAIIAPSGTITVSGDAKVSGASNYGIFGKTIKVTGNVEATATPNAVFATGGNIEIGGSVTAESSSYAVFSNNGDIIIGGNVTATASGYAVAAPGHNITITGDVIAKGEGYGIFAGSIKIDGNVEASGASYAVEATGGNIEIGGSVTAESSSNAIFAPGGDIIIGGDVTASSSGYAIYAPGHNITVSGDAIAKGGSYGIYARSVEIGGDTEAEGSLYSIMATGGDIEVGGSVKAVSTGESSICVFAPTGKITVASGTWDLTGAKAIQASGGIVIPETHVITLPENGVIGQVTDGSSTFYAVTDTDGETVAKHVIIEPIPVTKYPLWLGETQVTSLNAADILGDGTASFAPETNTLTFTTETPAITGIYNDALIYADGIDLTINAAEKLTLSNTVDYGDCVVVINGTLTINGDVDVMGDYFGLRGSSITVNGDVTAAGYQTIYAMTGSVYIDGDADVTGRGYAINAEQNIIVTGNVNVEGQSYGLYAKKDISVAGNLTANVSGLAIESRENTDIGGSLTVTGGTDTNYWSSVFVVGNLTVGGDVKVEYVNLYDIGIASWGTITVGPGRWEASGAVHAMWAEDGIAIPETHGITLPENGKIGTAKHDYEYYPDDYGDAVLNEDGSFVTHAVIEKVRNIKGDVSGDGVVDNRDLIMIARYLVKLVEFNDMQKEAADWNEDGRINNTDLVLIARYIVTKPQA